MSDDDEEALTWAGDEERGQERPRLLAHRRSPPDESTEPARAARDRQHPARGLRLLAGAYAIFTVGWVTSVVRSSTTLVEPAG